MPLRQGVVKSQVPLLVADVYECAGALRRAGEAIAASEGQTQARWQLLSVVADRPLTVPQAARRLGVSRQAVQRVANDLLQEALLRAGPNPEHRSSPLLSLTPSGRAVLGRITEAAGVLHRRLAAPVGAEEVEATRRVLRALVEQLSSGGSWIVRCPG